MGSCFYEKGLAFECQGCGYCCSSEPGYVFLSEKDININRKNNLIVADSNNHLIFDVIDTENLPDNAMSFLEFSKFYKRTHKQINDIKSQEFARMDYSKETVMSKLTEAFGEKLADRYYRMFFE